MKLVYHIKKIEEEIRLVRWDLLSSRLLTAIKYIPFLSWQNLISAFIVFLWGSISQAYRHLLCCSFGISVLLTVTGVPIISRPVGSSYPWTRESPLSRLLSTVFWADFTDDKYCLTSSFIVKVLENSSSSSCTIHPTSSQIQNRFISRYTSKCVLCYSFVVPATDFPRCISLTVIFSSYLLTYINCHQCSWLCCYYIFLLMYLLSALAFCTLPTAPLDKKGISERIQAEGPMANTTSMPYLLHVFWHTPDVSPPRQVNNNFTAMKLCALICHRSTLVSFCQMGTEPQNVSGAGQESQSKGNMMGAAGMCRDLIPCMCGLAQPCHPPAASMEQPTRQGWAEWKDHLEGSWKLGLWGQTNQNLD